MSRKQLEDQRRKRGECISCGRKCFQKKLFKTIPITDTGRVLNGRCLNCHPLDPSAGDLIPAESKIATSQDMERFAITQSNLARMQNARGATSTRSSIVSVAPSRSQDNQYWRTQSSRSLPVQPRAMSVRTSSSSGGYYAGASDVTSISEHTFEHTVATMPARTHHEHSLAPLPPPPPPPAAIASPSVSSFRSRMSNDSSDVDIPFNAGPASTTGADEYPLHFQERDVPDYGDTAREIPLDEDPPYHSRRGVEISQRSLRSSDSSDQYAFDQHPQSRVLNRGGAFSRQAIPLPPPLPPSSSSTDSPHQRPYRPSRMSNSQESVDRSSRAESSRSLDSNSSYEEPSNLPFMSPQQQQQQQQQRLETHKELSVEQYPHYNGSENSDTMSSNHIDHHGPPPPMVSDEQLLPAGTFEQQQQQQEHPGLVHLRAARADFVEILNVMRDYPHDIEVQSAALHELSEVELSEADNTALAQIGGIDVICKAMEAFPDALLLQTAGCRAVWNASGTPQNQHDFVEEQVLDLILQDMETFLEDASLQEQAMAALANLAALQVNLEIMVERGVVELVVQSMNKHGEEPQVQLKGCLVIANLSSHPTKLKKTIMDKGGGNALVIAMVIHQNEAELQEKALRGLRNLSANCDENKVELTNIGGIDAVIGAMRVHRDAASVQEAGAWTLSNLGGNVDSNALIGDCGGVDVIIRAMWVHSDTVSVLEWCCRALYTMALNERNSEMILEVGGITAVINAMQAHVDDSAVVQEMGCAILCSLSRDDQCKMRIVDEEALDAIVLAMVLYSEEPRVQERGCQVLLKVTIPENLRSMQASNATELVQVAAQKFPETCGEPASQLLELIEGYIAQYG